MSKFEALVQKYVQESEKFKFDIDEDLIRKVAKACGPSIYKSDSARVSESDPKEMAYLRKKFLIQKLGLIDSPKLDKGIVEVMAKFGKGNRNKYRPLVYALLAKKYKKENVFEIKKNQKKLVDFGEEFIEKQRNVDSAIKAVIESDFFEMI